LTPKTKFGGPGATGELSLNREGGDRSCGVDKAQARPFGNPRSNFKETTQGNNTKQAIERRKKEKKQKERGRLRGKSTQVTMDPKTNREKGPPWMSSERTSEKPENWGDRPTIWGKIGGQRHGFTTIGGRPKKRK